MMQAIKIKSITSLLLVGLALWAAPCALAASQQQTGKIKGLVLDSNDARIVRAKITISGENVKRTIESDDIGVFEIEVPAGVYQLRVESPGFQQQQVSQLQVKAGAVTSSPLRLAVEPSEPRFEGVEPEEMPIEPSNAPIGEKIPHKKLRKD